MTGRFQYTPAASSVLIWGTIYLTQDGPEEFHEGPRAADKFLAAISHLASVPKSAARRAGPLLRKARRDRSEAGVMTLKSAIESARTRFANNGRFSLLPDESIDEVVRRENVPNARGIYIIFRCDDLDRPLYIGRAGTIETSGSWKNQGLRERLTKKQERKPRHEFFCKLMADKGLAGLTFLWFVTHDQNSRIIPALAEMELLQAHYDTCGCLPELNKGA